MTAVAERGNRAAAHHLAQASEHAQLLICHAHVVLIILWLHASPVLRKGALSATAFKAQQ
jgi:hypothetical protein